MGRVCSYQWYDMKLLKTPFKPIAVRITKDLLLCYFRFIFTGKSRHGRKNLNVLAIGRFIFTVVYHMDIFKFTCIRLLSLRLSYVETR